jgi:hypothetical protein
MLASKRMTVQSHLASRFRPTASTKRSAVGLQILRAHDWIDGVGRNWALTGVVRNPEVTHSVRIPDFEIGCEDLDSGAGSKFSCAGCSPMRKLSIREARNTHDFH